MATAPVKITATDDSGPVHKVQSRNPTTPEIFPSLNVIQQFGLSSHAPVGSDAVALFIGGDRSNGLIVATNNQTFRLRNLNAGEVALYSQWGDTITIKQGNTISVTSKGTVEVEAPSVMIAGPGGGKATVHLAGDIIASGTITADTINAPNGHVGP
jgi:phage baseplate assembly protein V